MVFYRKRVGARFRRRVRSVARPVRRGLRQRYVPKNRRGKRVANLGNVMKDIAFIKRQLNTEWKNTGDFVYGYNTAVLPFKPTKSAPTCQALPYPATIGTSGVNDRIGKKVKICNLHMRWKIVLTTTNKQSTTDLINPVYYRIYVVWLKQASVDPGTYPSGPAFQLPTDELWKEDPEGNISFMSQFNELEYKNYLITAKERGVMKFQMPLNGDTNKGNEVRYFERNYPLQIHQEFNDDNILQTHRPFVCILTDNNDNINEHIEFNLIAKLSYVDN